MSEVKMFCHDLPDFDRLNREPFAINTSRGDMIRQIWIADKERSSHSVSNLQIELRALLFAILRTDIGESEGGMHCCTPVVKNPLAPFIR
jgi:hypothetical protein